MIHKAKVAVCSDIRTKHSTQSEHHAEFLNVKPWWYVKKPLGFKRLIVECMDLLSQQDCRHFYCVTEPTTHYRVLYLRQLFYGSS